MPQKVKDLLNKILSSLKEIFTDDLVGIYFYGSLIQGCFNPKQSDIDFIVIVKNQLTKNQEKEVQKFYKNISKYPEYGKRLEAVFYTLDQIKNALFPSPFLFCISHNKCRISKNNKDLDSDFPMTLAHVYYYGYALYGPNPKKIIPRMKWEILEPSIKEDIKFSINNARKNSVYVVLNLCRALYSLKTRDIAITKIQAGEWVLKNFPKKFNPIIKTALKAYKYELTKDRKRFLLENLEEFIVYALKI